MRRDEVLQGLDDGFKEDDEERVGIRIVVVVVGWIGGDDAVDLELERVSIGNEQVESLRGGLPSLAWVWVGLGFAREAIDLFLEI